MVKQMIDQMGEWLMMCMQGVRQHDQQQKAVLPLHAQTFDEQTVDWWNE